MDQKEALYFLLKEIAKCSESIRALNFLPFPYSFLAYPSTQCMPHQEDTISSQFLLLKYKKNYKLQNFKAIKNEQMHISSILLQNSD